ncbi:MAG: glycoside hydrolase family 31 protein [Anaerolineae bacterium]|nr:glycoside hydrolase family 31 protein [Anaerolineae bacterium]
MAKSTFRNFLQSAQGLGLQTALRAVQYNSSIRSLNRRYGKKKARGRFQTLGDVKSVEKRAHGAVVHTERGYVEISFLAPEIARVRMRTTPEFPPPFSYAVERIDWPPTTVMNHDLADAFTTSTDHLLCRIHKENTRLSFELPDGRVMSDDAEGIAWRESEIRWTRQLPAAERSYGLGQRASALNLRGKRLALWNLDPMPNYARDSDPTYYSIPFYLGVQPDRAIGILWDNPARGYADLGAEKSDQMTLFAEDGELRFYVFVGPNAQTVLKHYTALTGSMPLPPLWALGFHQSRWSYETEAEFRALAHDFRTRHLPCDALYFDIDYMDGYRVFTWNRERFRLLPGLLADLTAQGFKSVAILDPGIKVDEDYEIYQDGIRQNVFLNYPNEKPVTAPVWPGNCHFPDFTSARVRAWWSSLIPILTQAGFAGFWTDMNEPSIMNLQSEPTLPDYVVHDWDSAGQTHGGGGHNVYGMLMARATREGLKKQFPDKRPFVLTRAAYAGAQRYAASWTGDNASTWEHLRLTVSMVLNCGLSGMPFTGPDVGGFAGDADAELYTRWMQLGSTLPFFRAHSAHGTARQEPWSFGKQTEAIARTYLELRYQLLPYIYSTFAQCSQEGLPIVRPLFMLDPQDEALRGLDDEFMLGDIVLVAPVLKPGATKREVYLPKGVWYEYDTGKLIDGAQSVTADAPLERMPIYVRAGCVLPMWPVMQFVGESQIEEARLRVYAGSGDTTFYEDEGEGLAYRDGAYRWSYFTCKFLPSGQFAIQWRRAGQYHPPYESVRVEVVGISGEPEAVMLDGQQAPLWYYEDGVVEFIVKPFDEARIVGRSPNPAAQRTIVRPPSLRPPKR